MEYYRRRGIAPWVWVVVVLAALLLLLVIWWTVAAGSREERVVVVPREKEPIVVPTPTPSPPAQPQPPVVVERERPVNIYIERSQRPPRAVVIPRDQEPPAAREGMERLDLPGQFRFNGRLWQPTGEVITDMDLADTDADIDGHTIYARRAVPPYSEIYIESDPGSGVYLVYKPQ